MRTLEPSNRMRIGLMGIVVMVLVIGVGQSITSVPILFARNQCAPSVAMLRALYALNMKMHLPVNPKLSSPKYNRKKRRNAEKFFHHFSILKLLLLERRVRGGKYVCRLKTSWPAQ